jgi:trigger factor
VQTTLKRLDATQVEIEIPISADELKAAEERAFRELVKRAKIPGFRPGKVPRKIFEQQYGAELITERALDEIVPEAFGRALREHDVEPAGRPQFELLPQEDGLPLRVRATVSVRPEIVLGDYRNIEVAARPQTAEDEDLERAFEALRRDFAVLTPVDRPLGYGDVAVADFAGKIGGEPFEGGSAEYRELEIVEEHFIPGFAAGFVGMRAGETNEFEATFPADYSVAELAGKTAVFTVTVHDVKEPILPDADDAFASSVQSNATLLSLRADLRRRLYEATKRNARRAQQAELLETLLAKHDFPAPPAMLDREVEAVLTDRQRAIERLGRSWSDYLAETGETEDGLRAEIRPEAEGRVRSALLLEAIAKAEKVAPTPQEVDDELGRLAAQYGLTKAQIAGALHNNLGAVYDGIIRTKTLDLLLDSANVVPATKSEAT